MTGLQRRGDDVDPVAWAPMGLNSSSTCCIRCIWSLGIPEACIEEPDRGFGDRKT